MRVCRGCRSIWKASSSYLPSPSRSSTCEGSSTVCRMRASSSRVAASLVVTIVLKGAKSGATRLRSLTRTTTFSLRRVSLVGFDTASLITLTRGAAGATSAQASRQNAMRILLPSRGLQTRAGRGILGLHVDESEFAVGHFTMRRHHPKEIDGAAGSGDVGMIALGHDHAIAFADRHHQFWFPRIGVDEL